MLDGLPGMESVLLGLALALAVLVLLKQLRFFLGGSPAPERKAPPPGTHSAGIGGASSSSIRKRFGASLRESSAARSLGVSRGSPQPLQGATTPFKAKLESSLFSPARDDGDPDSLFLDLLKIITYVDDQLEQSAFGFSVSTKKNAGADCPWVDRVLPHGPASTKLKRHDRIVRINSESTQGWSAPRAQQAVLSSTLRLYLDVVPMGGGDVRQEVLYRGRLGRVHVLCQRCRCDDPCETSRALFHFAVLLEQAHSVADLRDAMLERKSDTVSAREREVFSKILAHAVPNADCTTVEPPGGPGNTPPGISSLNFSSSAASYKRAPHAAASPLRMSMLDSGHGERAATATPAAGVAASAKTAELEQVGALRALCHNIAGLSAESGSGAGDGDVGDGWWLLVMDGGGLW
jgi:hypothetical protein